MARHGTDDVPTAVAHGIRSSSPPLQFVRSRDRFRPVPCYRAAQADQAAWHRAHRSVDAEKTKNGSAGRKERRFTRSLASLIVRIPRSGRSWPRLVSGESIRAIAARLARAPSTISREIARNGGLLLSSCAGRPGRLAADTSPKQCKLAQSATLAAQALIVNILTSSERRVDLEHEPADRARLGPAYPADLLRKANLKDL